MWPTEPQVSSSQGSPRIRKLGSREAVAINVATLSTAKFPNPNPHTAGWGRVMPPYPIPMVGWGQAHPPGLDGSGSCFLSPVGLGWGQLNPPSLLPCRVGSSLLPRWGWFVAEPCPLSLMGLSHTDPVGLGHVPSTHGAKLGLGHAPSPQWATVGLATAHMACQPKRLKKFECYYSSSIAKDLLNMVI